jgi:hypothetical protein
MAARTAVPYSLLVANSSLADPAGTALDATNDHVINAAKPERTILRVSNTAAAAKTITVKAGDNPPALAAGLGDVTYELAAGNITEQFVWIGPFESGRFLQNDGTMHVDVATDHTGTITAFLVPAAV